MSLITIETRATFERAPEGKGCQMEWDVFSRGYEGETDYDRRRCPYAADFTICTETSTNGGRTYRTARYVCARHVPRRYRKKVWAAGTKEVEG